ncbi:MAG: hypothetical protein QGG53_35590 [Planctomycetota bacterium]|jgi:predicted nucleic acid-binding protein|nr:hypothetical protein [Planctomycetota bacterium]
MDSDQNTDAEPESERNLTVSAGTTNLTSRISPDGYLVALPLGRKLSQDEMRELDREIGVQPLAIEEAYTPRQKTYYELLVNLGCIVVCAAALWQFFPWSHFFVITPRTDKADLTLELMTDEEAQEKGEQLTEEERTRLELTRLKDAGRLIEMVQLSTARLANVPKNKWTEWHRVWDIFLWSLEKTSNYELLRDRCSALMEADQDSRSARYYKAVTLINFSEKRKYTEREKATYSRDTERAIVYLQQAIERLDSQIEGVERTEADEESLAEVRRRYRLKLADAHIKRWFAGGLAYGDEPDVNQHREVAINILKGLGDWVPAIRMRIHVFRVMKKQRTWNPFFKHWYGGKWVGDDVLKNEIDLLERMMEKARKAASSESD